MPHRRKSYGLKTFAEQAVIPRGSGFETRIQHERHLQRDTKTMQCYRYGWRLMWRAAEKEMKKHKIPRACDPEGPIVARW